MHFCHRKILFYEFNGKIKVSTAGFGQIMVVAPEAATRVLYKKDVLENFAIFTRNGLVGFAFRPSETPTQIFSC